MGFTEFLKLAREALDSHEVIVDSGECAAYATDWTKVKGAPRAVFLPNTPEKVAQLLKFCHQHEIAVIASGGRTGLAGGAAATNGEVVLALNHLRQVHKVDLFGRTVRVQAGVTTQEVHELAAKEGLTWPIDLAAKGSSTIGGNLSTNAGGVRVIRYGMARKWVTALQIVTITGEIIELNRNLEKNNTGYDLLQLMIGAEGTLAVITEATLRLAPLPKQSAVFLMSAPSLESLMAILLSAREMGCELLAFEYFSDRCRTIVEKQLGRKSPLAVPSPYYALIEIENPTEAHMGEWIESLLEEKVIVDGTMGTSQEEKRRLWELREGITESIAKTAPVKKYDVAVPVRETGHFLKEAIREAEKYAGFVLYTFGHLGDGSPHLNLVRNSDAFEKDCIAYEKWIFATLKAMGGSCAAEHGVGILKKHWLAFSKTPSELDIFRQIKRAFDPKGLLNPGKVIDV